MARGFVMPDGAPSAQDLFQQGEVLRGVDLRFQNPLLCDLIAGGLAQNAVCGDQRVERRFIYNDNDPIGVLDVTISSNLILDEILGIKDLRSDKRIDFVGGIRGLGELKKRVDSGEMKVALALYPVSMKQLMDIADTGNIMPPKTTWFEPKLRSGLVIHKLE